MAFVTASAAGTGVGAATVSYPLDLTVCIPATSLTATLPPGLACGADEAVLIRQDSSYVAASAAAIRARAEMVTVLALVAAASEAMRRGAMIWRQAGVLGDVPLLRADISVLRGGLPGGGPLPARIPVANIAGPMPGLDPSDVVFPGEAAARFWMWRLHRGRLLEWTGWWGSVLVPFGTARASSSVEFDGPQVAFGLPPVPKQGFSVMPPIALPKLPGSIRDTPFSPVPVPVSGGFVPLLSALFSAQALCRRRRARRCRRSGADPTGHLDRGTDPSCGVK